jgi:hypothetical protein
MTDQELRVLARDLLAKHSSLKAPFQFDAEHVWYFAGVLMGEVMRVGPERLGVMRSIRIVAELFELLERDPGVIHRPRAQKDR